MGLYIQIDWTDTEGTAYKIEIDKPDWNGNVFQVRGSAVLEYPKVKTMDVLRGSVLKMQLEASKEFLGDTWINGLIGEVGDKKLKTTLYRSGSVFWNGFIKPDGIVESFVTDYWVVNVQAIDGLGYLKDIKFLDADKKVYRGAVNELDLLTRCLQLTGLEMNFRVYDFNLFFTTDENAPVNSSQNKAIRGTYLNTYRFVKETSGNEVFDTKEVLEAILKKYGAFVIQQNNEWHIVRLIDFYQDDTIDTRLYDSDGVFISDTTVDMRTSLGSEINGFNPFHANANQQKTYGVALGAYKVAYDYGEISSALENSEIYFNDNLGNITGWTLDAGATDINYRLEDGNYIAQVPFKSNSTTSLLVYDEVTYPQNFEEGDTLKLEYEIESYIDMQLVSFAYLKRKHYIRVILEGDNGQQYFLNDTGEWTLSNARILAFYFKDVGIIVKQHKDKWEGTSNGLPADGQIVVQFYYPYTNANVDNGSFIEHRSMKVIDVSLAVKGESYTARRLEENPSTVVDLTAKLKHGDGDNDAFVGSIENSGGLETVQWSKLVGGVIDASKQYKLLNWLARDRMTISSGNSTVFSGGIYGHLNCLGVLSIDNVPGIFMTLGWSYDLRANVITATHERIFTDDIYSNVTVEFKYEGGDVIRPAIE